MTDGDWTRLIDTGQTEDEVDYQARVRIEVEGEFYTCYLNGQRWSSFNDPTLASGRVGLQVLDRYASFDNFKVTPLLD